jgi:hypothetical protein
MKTKQQLKEQILHDRERLQKLNPKLDREKTWTSYSLGWDMCLLFLAEQHGLDLTKL